MVTVATDGTASFERTGGMPTVMDADMASSDPIVSRPTPQQVTFIDNGNTLSINSNDAFRTVVDGAFVRERRPPGVTYETRTDYPVFDYLPRSLSEAQQDTGYNAWYFYGSWSNTTRWTFGGRQYDPTNGKDIASFGVHVEDAGLLPFAGTVNPLTPFADSPSIQGEMEVGYIGTLVGVTRQSSQPLGAGVDIDLELGEDITGTIAFTDLSTIERDGSLKPFLEGSLTHDIAVDGNTFTTTGGDPGTVTGIFAGETHAAAAGTVEHPAFVGAFSAERYDDGVEAVVIPPPSMFEYTVTGSGRNARITDRPYATYDGVPEEPYHVGSFDSEYDGFVQHILTEPSTPYPNVWDAVVYTAQIPEGMLSWGIWDGPGEFDPEGDFNLLDPGNSAFHEGPAYSGAGLVPLTGRATYKGIAYAHGYDGGELDTFEWAFLTSLTADFGSATESGHISGTMTNEGLGDDGIWSVALSSIPLTANSADFSSSASNLTATYREGSLQYTATGSWQGAFRGGGNTPSGVTGTFSASAGQEEAFLVGAFGATRR